MECDACREILSARLDGEDLPGEAAAADAHLATCDACAQWWEAAARVTRLARLSAVPEPGPVSERLAPERLATAAPGPGSRRLAMALRWMLGLLGVGQFLLGITQVSLAGSAHGHSGGLSPDHLWHESAAWNIAIGAGFAWIALRRTPPSALLPLLTAFVVMLGLLSANDVWVGTVDGARLVSHALVAIGYVVVVALSRPRFDFGDPPALRGSGPVRPVGGRSRPDVTRPATAEHRPLRLVTRALAAPVARWLTAATPAAVVTARRPTTGEPAIVATATVLGTGRMDRVTTVTETRTTTTTTAARATRTGAAKRVAPARRAALTRSTTTSGSTATSALGTTSVLSPSGTGPSTSAGPRRSTGMTRSAGLTGGPVGRGRTVRAGTSVPPVTATRPAVTRWERAA